MCKVCKIRPGCIHFSHHCNASHRILIWSGKRPCLGIWHQPNTNSHYIRSRSYLLHHTISEKIQVGLQTICDIIEGIERVKQSIGKGVIKVTIKLYAHSL